MPKSGTSFKAGNPAGEKKSVKAIGIQKEEGLGFGIRCMPVIPRIREADSGESEASLSSSPYQRMNE